MCIRDSTHTHTHTHTQNHGVQGPYECKSCSALTCTGGDTSCCEREGCREVCERMDCSTPDCRAWLDNICPTKEVSRPQYSYSYHFCTLLVILGNECAYQKSNYESYLLPPIYILLHPWCCLIADAQLPLWLLNHPGERGNMTMMMHMLPPFTSFIHFQHRCSIV